MEKKREVREALDRLKELARKRQNKLYEAHEIQRFFRETDKAISWLNEKSIPLAIEDCGRDLVSVQALQRKHEALERDLGTLEDKVSQLTTDAEALSEKHPDSRDTIQEKRNTLTMAWQDLKAKAADRRAKLEESFLLHRFLADWRDLTLWIADTKAIISADKLAKDVAGAEALVERHNEHKGEIDSREDAYRSCMEEGQRLEHRAEIDARAGTFDNFDAFGHELLENKHYASPEIEKRIEETLVARDNLLKAWQDREKALEQNLKQQQFLRDCEQAEDWMSMRESSLVGTSGDDVDKVDALIKKHENFNRAITAQEAKIQALDASANALLAEGHYDAPGIEAKREEVLGRWAELKQAMIENRSRLGDVQTLQAFLRDADEMEIWINEKLQATMDDSYKDPTINVQAKHQKHQAFQAELAANAERLQAILGAGQRLIEKGQCKGQENAVEERLTKLADQWEDLIRRSEEKSAKLQEANRQAAYNAGVKDIEFWLGEVEASLASPDYGKDSASVDSLLSKHQVLTTDIQAHEDRISELNARADELYAAGAIDADTIKERKRWINERYEKIRALSENRAITLGKAKCLHDFYRNLDDEEAWIREKKILVSSEDYGRDLISVRNLKKKHKRLEAEIIAHKPAVHQVTQQGQELMSNTELADPVEIQRRIDHLNQAWEELQTLTANRDRKLDESSDYQDFLDAVEEETAWILEKQHLLSSDDHGDTSAAVQGLVKQHEAFETDLKVHHKKCEEICRAGSDLIERGNHNKVAIEQKCEGLREKLEVLVRNAERRKALLLDNHAFLQFMWKTDVVELWIADREAQVRSEDYGRDLSSVQTLLTKHETFDTALESFRTEGIKTITELHDQLIQFDTLIGRWERLKSESERRKNELLQLQSQYKKVEELYLDFAKRASTFNSWFENAEEDLTDPVRCNSLDEIRALVEAQEQFKASLKPAEADFQRLRQLDKEIKGYGVEENPYTWFNMVALEDTWRNLQKIIQERDEELRRELARQEQNDQLRQEFAAAANSFHAWLQSVRNSLMEGTGTLEEQLEAIRAKSVEIRSRKVELKQIEELGARLEERLILDNRYTKHSTVSVSFPPQTHAPYCCCCHQLTALFLVSFQLCKKARNSILLSQ
ncbi:Spectrin alpha chain [Taenia solium]|eukprot:TsM_000861200 transcript=TsM_000861200 gene=TsM_000861200